jgi:hypothetical protein
VTVYVDEIRRYPTSIACFKGGSCHMTADTLDELHAMANRIGLRREWFQDKWVKHYDLTPPKRELAIAAGCVFVPARQQAIARVEARQKARAAAVP